MLESQSEDALVLLVKLEKSTVMTVETVETAETAETAECWLSWDCIDWRSVKSISYSLTHLLTAWKQEMLAHLKSNDDNDGDEKGDHVSVGDDDDMKKDH